MNVHIVHALASETACATDTLLLVDDQTVVGRSTFAPFIQWSHTLGRSIGSPLNLTDRKGLLWTDFALKDDALVGSNGWTEEAGALLCAIMEYALLEEAEFLALESDVELLEHCASAGWRVRLLERPRMMGGRTTVAASVAVNEQALQNVRRASHQTQVFLPARPPNKGAAPTVGLA
jgi:hypothetical protein